jgi:hypothetical protein
MRWKLTAFFAMGVATGLALFWIAACIGCAALQATAETSLANTVDVPIEAKAETFVELNPDVQAAVGVAVRQSSDTITNEIWPWLIGGFAIIAVTSIPAILLLRRVIIQNSYSVQKPRWEASKKKGTGVSCDADVI